MRPRLLSGSIVEVYVGDAKRQWSLHRNLLCHASPFFEEHFGVESKKKGDKLELTNAEPDAFELFVKWLYQGKIDDVSEMPTEKKWDYAETCQKLYFLCDQLALQQLKNLAIDEFRKGCNQAGLVPGPEEMKPVYDNTPPSSPFRTLVSKIAARQIMDPESEVGAGTYRMCFEGSSDFAVDVIDAIRAGSGSKLFEDPTEGDKCLYHVHDNGKPCDRG